MTQNKHQRHGTRRECEYKRKTRVTPKTVGIYGSKYRIIKKTNKRQKSCEKAKENEENIQTKKKRK